jgi:hypothetical protein
METVRAVLQAPFSEKGVNAIPFTGEPLIRRKCIEPVHYKGGFRLPRLTGCES